MYMYWYLRVLVGLFYIRPDHLLDYISSEQMPTLRPERTELVTSVYS